MNVTNEEQDNEGLNAPNVKKHDWQIERIQGTGRTPVP
jgi:hypothetical protein